MTVNIAFSRPASVALVLLGIAVLGGVALALAAADRDGLIAERDAKSGFVARSLASIRRTGATAEDPGRDLAIEADSATLAAARIDALLRATLVEAGGVVLSSRAETREADAAGGPNQRIETQAVVQGTMVALQASLYRLESGRPLVLVEALDLRPADEGEAAGRLPAAPILTATLTLSAFWKRTNP